MRINQFHSGTAKGDAITNQMFLIQKILKNNGYDSEIYAEYIPKELAGKVKPIQEYHQDRTGILMVHHSMGINCFEQIVHLSDKKILIYHNITPERFFKDEYLKKYIRLGLKQAESYKDYIKYCVADSNYNRQQLIRMGHSCDIDVMPVQISLNRFDELEDEQNIIEENRATRNIIFVGRVVENKCQHDVIKAFAVYNRYFEKNSKLFIIGDNSMSGYVDELEQLAERLEVSDKIVFTGKISDSGLKTYYRIADVFLCMSEHEGFGVPLLESMKMGVPVIAYRSSAIPETMGGAGILVTEKNYAYIGALLNEVINDRNLYEALVKKQLERIERLESTDTEKLLLHIISNVQSGERKRTIQMQGPFETSYSLAIVNRKLIEAIDDMGVADVSIFCTEGPGDYQPSINDLKDKPHAKALWKKSANVNYPDITIRNMFPPRVHDVNGGLNFQAFGWEESVIPEKYILNFNKYLSGIGTMSNYVTEKLIECGLKIPVKTMGIGVELIDDYEKLKPYPVKTKKKIKFLHISSAFPRKGVDVLLKGYYEAFTNKDDVCLVLKTFPNPHNKVAEILDQLNQEYLEHPEVEWINCDLDAESLYSLYKIADCYVQAARGEGFGLPVAEAMLARIPVIVCANSGMADFCNKDTALLVDYTLEPANTHVTTNGMGNVSLWAEPDVESLVKRFKEFANGIERKELEEMVDCAYAFIHNEYTWQKVAERWYKFIEEVEQDQFKPKVAMVSTWNSKCGIAEYTKMEVEASSPFVDYQIYPNYGVELLAKDEMFVEERVWHSAFEGNLEALVNNLSNSPNDIIHFQFNFGFFKLEHLSYAIQKLVSTKKVVITFHKTEDSMVGQRKVSLKSIVNNLNECSALIVHQQRDKELLKEYGVKSSLIRIIKHGQLQYPETGSALRKQELGIKSAFVIGSYGFLLPHKGIKEVIQAVAEMKKRYSDVLYMPVCALHDSVESKEYLQECLEEVERLDLKENVRFVTDFLPNDESMKYLQACDVLVMPYKPSKESASGAIRFCLAALRPIITTNQPIFDEFKSCTYQIEKTDKDLIIRALETMADYSSSERYVKDMKKYIQETSWNQTAQKFYKLYRELCNYEV